MGIEELQTQIAMWDQEIAKCAQQSRQAEANWNYARGVRAGLSVWLEKLQSSLAEGSSGDKKELSAEEAQQPHPSPPQKGGDRDGVG